MAVFAVTYEYGPDIDTRMENRPAHRTWQSKLFDAGVLLASGPLDDDFIPGGLIILKADTRAKIEDILMQDPYASIGVIQGTTIREWNPVLGPFAPQG